MMERDQLKKSMQNDAVNAKQYADGHHRKSVNVLARHRDPERLQVRNFNSKISRIVGTQHSGGTRRTKKIESLGEALNRGGRDAWDDAYFYEDDKGNKAVVLCNDITKEPYEIRMQIPNGGKTDIYIINTTTLMNHDNVSVDEAGSVMWALAGQLESGASIAELMQDFKKYQRSPYPPEIARQEEEQQVINDEIRNRVLKLKESDRYGICIFDAPSNDFDPYMQGKYQGVPTVSLFQNNRDLSGDMETRTTESYGISFQCAKQSKDVSEIVMTAMRDYESGKSYTSDYHEYMNIETLMEMGYDRENAQRKLNEVAEQVLDGKPLKEIFLNNRQFLTKQSAEKLKADMEKKNKQQKPDTSHIIRRRENQR